MSTGCMSGRNVPASMRLMLNRFATNRSRRSVSSIMMSSSSLRVASSYVSSRSQVGGDRVDRRERCPQVVRHGTQQRAPLRVDVVQRVHLRGHERARDERHRAEHDERDRIFTQPDARRAEWRQRERERKRRDRGDDERGCTPAEHRRDDDGDDEQQRRDRSGDVVVQRRDRQREHDRQQNSDARPRGAGEVGRGAAPWPPGCHPAREFRPVRQAARKAKGYRYTYVTTHKREGNVSLVRSPPWSQHCEPT